MRPVAPAVNLLLNNPYPSHLQADLFGNAPMKSLRLKLFGGFHACDAAE